MEKKPFYSAIAQTLQAMRNCEKSHDDALTAGNDAGRSHWAEMCDMHSSRIAELCKEHLPHGSGFDSGCDIDMDASTPDKLVFSADFHHMDDNGYYCGWSTHTVIVRASLAFGFSMRVTGRNMRDIKDYIADTFHYCLKIGV